jgi:hypothetical protein
VYSPAMIGQSLGNAPPQAAIQKELRRHEPPCR